MTRAASIHFGKSMSCGHPIISFLKMFYNFAVSWKLELRNMKHGVFSGGLGSWLLS
jgi:hypothetical protein